MNMSVIFVGLARIITNQEGKQVSYGVSSLSNTLRFH
jgi:hypothetical protein